MSITKYKTGSGSFAAAKIDLVEVERETDSSVWIDGRRKGKVTDWDRHHDSWEQAHAYLTDVAARKVLGARRALELANAFSGNVKGMKKPAPSLPVKEQA